LYDVALKLCGLAAALLLAVGALALISPRRLARSYGVEVDDARSFVWVRASGARDIALGTVLASSAFLGDATELLVICAAGVALSLADFVLAVSFARRVRSEHGAHLGGAIAFLVIIVLLVVSSRTP
jgi:hypothetical protein